MATFGFRTHSGAAKKRGFFWRGILILLPVAALALAGFYSIRHDRLLVEQEAQNQAQKLADEITRNISDSIDKLINSGKFESAGDGSRMVLTLDAQGNLISPPPLQPAPLPCLNTNLTLEQSRLWGEAQASEYVQEDPERAVIAWKALLETIQDTNIAAEAWYRIGLLQATNNPAEAAKAFMQVIRDFPGATLESGLPAGSMATLQWLRFCSVSNETHLRDLPSLDSLCQGSLEKPTLLTPLILFEADKLQSKKGLSLTNDWLAVWRLQEQERQWHQSTMVAREEQLSRIKTISGFSTEPHYFWLEAKEMSWSFLVKKEDLKRKITSSTRGRWLYHDTKRLASLTRLNNGHWLFQGIIDFTANDIMIRPVMRLIRNSPQFGCVIELAGRQFFLCRCFDKKDNQTAMEYPSHANYLDNNLVLNWINPELNHNFTVPPFQVATEKKMYDNFASKLNRSFNRSPLLATAETTSGVSKLVTTRVYLTCPSILYEAQRSRSLRFGLLIAAALATVLAGLFSAWRAFDKQARLVELKGNFISSVSHEMRAPIASIRLMAEGLENGRVKDEPKRKEYFRFIVQECRRMSGLIENVLDFARIERGQLKINWQVVDILELVRQTVAIQSHTAAERQVSLVVCPPPAPDKTGTLTATVDERAIQQVLVNLIDNAIKHSQSGGSVEIGIEPVEDSPERAKDDKWFKKQVRVWVQDHGDGIPLADQKHIFEAFYRSGMELRRRTQGTGLGLTIVKHLVEANHGTVSFQSTPGHGARFTIELP